MATGELTETKRKNIIKLVLVEGRSLAEVARKYKCSPQTIRKIVDEYQQKGTISVKKTTVNTTPKKKQWGPKNNLQCLNFNNGLTLFSWKTKSIKYEYVQVKCEAQGGKCEWITPSCSATSCCPTYARCTGTFGTSTTTTNTPSTSSSSSTLSNPLYYFILYSFSFSVSPKLHLNSYGSIEKLLKCK
ncbi:hypothetical protein DFA_08346 [Cavenderia fasciculata]|uniref:Insertion element IS150 protein InsJ-like helix-turn-helix domain-containing protein n=1 Tax=Cavenderia fasciculata TaxID=261658 RepID=F4Q5U2_CACFS|nr:uncharacterized protein DFA_08346 [Cavenderia fasciculata]EGG17351.1 hypothetical protein DFA_08346 [Cavenderia fasciculata]|eukprot:XP_004355835.1 hypothetical protein DFA_08346 [Cavenderia fasciculata]